MRSRVKNAVASVLGPVARLMTARRARILMYHRFGVAGDFRRTDVELFEQQIRYLVEHFNPRRLNDVVNQMRAGEPLEERTVVITVDEAYGDFLEHAYPVLKRYGVPATLYVVSEFANGRLWLWFDAIHWLVHAAASGRYEVQLGGHQVAAELTSAQSRNALWSLVAAHCGRQLPGEQSATLEALQRSLHIELPKRPSADYAAMTWEEIRSLDSNLVEIGAHTCTHPILALCTVEEQRKEISGCRHAIAEKTGVAPVAFCYPNGLPDDFTAETAAIVRECGFASAVMACGGTIDGSADLYRLERVGVPGNMSQFRNCANGLWELRSSLGRDGPRDYGESYG
jgi:peptidoglycan/xylan/chitin deacetylase (PgdA/CDA1 family)